MQIAVNDPKLESTAQNHDRNIAAGDGQSWIKHNNGYLILGLVKAETHRHAHTGTRTSFSSGSRTPGLRHRNWAASVVTVETVRSQGPHGRQVKGRRALGGLHASAEGHQREPPGCQRRGPESPVAPVGPAEPLQQVCRGGERTPTTQGGPTASAGVSGPWQVA